MNAFLKTVRETPAPEGTAVLWWLGQMGLMVKMGDTLACVDYYATPDPDRQVPPPVPAGEMEGIDLFLGTHDHLDHIDHRAWRIWARTCPEAKFIFPAVHRQTVEADGIAADRCLGLNDGESCRAGGMTIRAVAAAHEFLDRDPETGLYPFLQYVIEGNGLRIWHAGDTVRYEGMVPKIRALGPMDAALLPINGRDAKRYRSNCIGNMTFQEAADAAGEVRPGLTMPGHWDMFAHNSENPEKFADYLDAKYGTAVPCRIPRILEPVVLKAKA